jgi:hypothetical protein
MMKLIVYVCPEFKHKRMSVLLSAAMVCLLPLTTTAQDRDNQSGTPAIEVAKSDSASVPGTSQAGAYPASASSTSQAGTYPTKESGSSSQQPTLQTTQGPVKVGVYGTLLLNLSASDSTVAGGDVPLWASPSVGNVTFPDGSVGRAHDLYITARQTIIGFTIDPSSPLTSGWSPSAVVEMDFFGSRPADTLLPDDKVFNEPRLRLAYFQIVNGSWKIVAGQDKAIIAPLDPISLSHVGVPLGATAGNLWARLPQLRVDKTQHFGEKTSALYQFGILRPEFGDRRLGDTPAAGASLDTASAGTRSSMPFYEARVALAHPMFGSNATIGAGVHYGREVIGVSRGRDSWAVAFDFDVPLQSRLILRGEAYAGSNLIPFMGGIDQGLSAIPAAQPFTKINKIGDAGGWGELTFRLTKDDKNHFYVGAGTDDPVRHDLLLGSNFSRNTLYWASYFHRMSNHVTLALEWSNWQFRTTGFTGNIPGPRGPYGRANVFSTAFAYSF